MAVDFTGLHAAGVSSALPLGFWFNQGTDKLARSAILFPSTRPPFPARLFCLAQFLRMGRDLGCGARDAGELSCAEGRGRGAFDQKQGLASRHTTFKYVWRACRPSLSARSCASLKIEPGGAT